MNKEHFRVYLRALELEDYHKTHKWRNDPVYQEGVVSVKRYISLDTEKRWIENAIKEHENQKVLRFGITLKESNEIIGVSSLHSLNLINRNSRYSYFLGKERGKGFMKEAHYLTLEYAFKEIGLMRVAAGVLDDNIASIKSLEKIGFTKEGLFRNAVFKNGMFRNLLEYSMLREEFLKI
jgi:RimJ/RimL family protein N-acetyltransferase